MRGVDWLVAYCCLGFVLFLMLSQWERFPGEELRITMFDVGQGDAMFIRTPGRQNIVVDGGPDMSFLEHLGDALPFFDRRIDLLILSHTDADHLRALPALVERYHVSTVLMTGAWRETSAYSAFLDALGSSSARILFARADRDVDLGNGTIIDVLWPMEEFFGRELTNPNDASIVAKIIWMNHEILLTGDIEEEGELALLRAGYDLRSDLLKVQHHGSKTSSSTGFLLAAAPEVALISAGRDNRYGHPHKEVTDRYAALGIPVRETAREGTIDIVLR